MLYVRVCHRYSTKATWPTNITTLNECPKRRERERSVILLYGKFNIWIYKCNVGFSPKDDMLKINQVKRRARRFVKDDYKIYIKD